MLCLQPQLLAMKKKVDIVIACPGRLIELRDKYPKHCSLKGVTTVVIDEADKMVLPTEFSCNFNVNVQLVLVIVSCKWGFRAQC